LFAQTDAPTPLPQTATPRSNFSDGNGAGQWDDKVWIIIVQVRLPIAEIELFMTSRAQHPDQIFL
jgi:hypothetical protein